MLKFPCLVLDHDETVVQSEKTIGYPCFCKTLSRLRPDRTITLDEYVNGCHQLGFVDMCRQWFAFTDEEMQEEYNDWMEYVRSHTPDPFPGIDDIIHKQNPAVYCALCHIPAVKTSPGTTRYTSDANRMRSTAVNIPKRSRSHLHILWRILCAAMISSRDRYWWWTI